MPPPGRRSRPAGNGPANVELLGTDTVPPTTANREALRRRLARVARDEDARGHHDEAAIARWFMDEGAA